MNNIPKSLDERLEFLLHSSESMHSNLQELHAIAAEHDRQIEALLKLTEQTERRWQRVMRVLRDALDAGLKDNEEGDKKQ